MASQQKSRLRNFFKWTHKWPVTDSILIHKGPEGRRTYWYTNGQRAGEYIDTQYARRKNRRTLRKTGHPRIAHGQRYPMPCLGPLPKKQLIQWTQKRQKGREKGRKTANWSAGHIRDKRANWSNSHTKDGRVNWSNAIVTEETKEQQGKSAKE